MAKISSKIDQNLENKKEKNNKKIFVIILFVLILFMFMRYTLSGFSNIHRISPIPLPPEEESKVIEEPEKEIDVKKPSAPVINIIEDEPEEIIDPSIFSIRDTNVKWENASDLKIFQTESVRSLLANNTIAPGFSDKYEFVVRNNTGLLIEYSMEFAEINDKNLNMKYKLFNKTDNLYLCGDEHTWVQVKDMTIDKMIMNSGTKKEYVLEWIWFEGENDNQYGTSNEPIKYEIYIVVRAEEVINEENS